MNFYKLASILFFRLVTLVAIRNKNKWVIGSWFGNRYVDNSKYLCEYLRDADTGVDFIFVTKNKNVYEDLKRRGIACAYFWSLKSIWSHLTAGVFIYDQSLENDINYPLSLGATYVNLWHAFPIKKVYALRGLPKRTSLVRLRSFFKNYILCYKNRYILTTSNLSREILSKAFETPYERCIQSVYPRNEYLRNKISSREATLPPSFGGKKVILYLPTFRDKRELEFLGTSDRKKLKNLTDKLSTMGYALVSKFHSADNTSLNASFSDETGVINLESDFDIYPLLKKADLLITDYSSVYFDYLFLDKEILFLAYDLDYYINEDRGLIFDYNEFTPGEKLETLSDIPNAIKRIESGDINYSHQRDELRKKVFDEGEMSDLINIIRSL